MNRGQQRHLRKQPRVLKQEQDVPKAVSERLLKDEGIHVGPVEERLKIWEKK